MVLKPQNGCFCAQPEPSVRFRINELILGKLLTRNRSLVRIQSCLPFYFQQITGNSASLSSFFRTQFPTQHIPVRHFSYVSFLRIRELSPVPTPDPHRDRPGRSEVPRAPIRINTQTSAQKVGTACYLHQGAARSCDLGHPSQ